MIRIFPRRPFHKLNLGLFFLLSGTVTRTVAPARSFSVVAGRLGSRQRTAGSSLVGWPPSLRGGATTASYTTAGTRTSLNNMMSTAISFVDDAAASKGSREDVLPTTTVIVGKKKVLQELALSDKLPPLDAATATAVLDAIEGPSGSASTFGSGQHKLVLACIPDSVSRNNHPWSVHTITDLVGSSGNIPKGNGKTTRIVFVGSDALDYQGALASAVAKAFPVFSRKTTSNKKKPDDATENDRSIQIAFWDDTGSPLAPSPEASTTALAAVEGIQLAARLVDTPPEELTTDAYAAECRYYANTLKGVTMTEIVGEDLDQKGYGGIYGVGKAATCPPRLVCLEYTPPPSTSTAKGESESDDTPTIALVGKAIVYDTGGLSLKPKAGMCGMKADMGGSAGVLGGFVAAVKSGYPHKLVLLLCMAENAIGPTAFRNDDILTMYSGKTVEVNNCDAEGRLVLGDGVAHATKHIPNLSLVVDMATLTGAQLVATGKKHAGILANTPELEVQAVAAGLRSGDLAYPLLYAPELLKKEFNSMVADMKNSVKDRSNAQTSCAGHFIESHLDEDYKGGWLHVDMAGPATNAERGTGYGVGFVLSLLGRPGF